MRQATSVVGRRQRGILLERLRELLDGLREVPGIEKLAAAGIMFRRAERRATRFGLRPGK
jgi:hypothetical protein